MQVQTVEFAVTRNKGRIVYLLILTPQPPYLTVDAQRPKVLFIVAVTTLYLTNF